MEDMCTKNGKLPFKCRALCISLAGASALLIIDFILYYQNYISTESAIWIATAIFVLAAIYESFLLSVITRHMIKRLNQDANEP